MKKLSYKSVFLWMQDRTLQGIRNEESGSMDSLEDADGFLWYCTVDEVDGRKLVNFTTSLNPIAFAVGRITKTGRPRITWL